MCVYLKGSIVAARQSRSFSRARLLTFLATLFLACTNFKRGIAGLRKSLSPLSPAAIFCVAQPSRKRCFKFFVSQIFWKLMYAYSTSFGDMRQTSTDYSAASRRTIVAGDQQGAVVGMVAVAVPPVVNAGAAPVAHELRDAVRPAWRGRGLHSTLCRCLARGAPHERREGRAPHHQPRRGGRAPADGTRP